MHGAGLLRSFAGVKYPRYGRADTYHPGAAVLRRFADPAYTNRFLSYAQLVRTLKEQHLQHPSNVTRAQIDNLRRRLHLTRTMQILGVTSLFLCVVTMFLLYIGLILLSAYVFGAALLLLIGSLGVSIWEIQISVRALEIHLHDMEK